MTTKFYHPEAERFNQAFIYLRAKGPKAGGVLDKRDLAKKLGFSYNHLSPIFSGRLPLSLKLAKQMQGTFGISQAWLIHNMGSMELEHGVINPEHVGRYISDNTIFHVPYDKVGEWVSNYKSPEFLDTLEIWSMPGIKGEYFSFSVDISGKTDGGYLVVCRPVEVGHMIPGRRYTVIGKGNALEPVQYIKTEGKMIVFKEHRMNNQSIKGILQAVTSFPRPVI